MKRTLLLALLIVTIVLVPSHARGRRGHCFLMGTWVNICPYQTTGSIAAFVITKDLPDGDSFIFVFGRGESSLEPWGWAPCTTHSSDPEYGRSTGFTAYYDLGGCNQIWIIAERIDDPTYKLLRVVEIGPCLDHWPVSTFVRID